MAESSSSPRRIEAKEKAARALEMRKGGATYDQIAKQIGYAQSAGAKKAIDRALKETIQEPAEQLRQLELTRLDNLFRVAYGKALRGEMPATDRCLRIMEHRARLLGLEAPTKLDVQHRLVKGYVNVSPDDWPSDIVAPTSVIEGKPAKGEDEGDDAQG